MAAFQHSRDPSAAQMNPKSVISALVSPLVLATVAIASIIDVVMDYSLVYWVLLAVIAWIIREEERRHFKSFLKDQEDAIEERVKQLVKLSRSSTPKESTDWLNHLILHLWPNIVQPAVLAQLRKSLKDTVATHLPAHVLGIHVDEFSLGSIPPEVGLGTTHWSTDANGQEILTAGIHWSSSPLSIQLSLRLRRQVIKILVSSIRLEGQMNFVPILGGQAVLFAFEKAPVVDLQLAVLADVSEHAVQTRIWLEQALADTLTVSATKPGCLLLPSTLIPSPMAPIRRLHVTLTLVSGSNLRRGLPSDPNPPAGYTSLELTANGAKRQLGRSRRRGPEPTWDSQGSSHLDLEVGSGGGVFRLEAYEWALDGGIFSHFLGDIEVKVVCGNDGSAFFWAMGSRGTVAAVRVPSPGCKARFTAPLQNAPSGLISIDLEVKKVTYWPADSATTADVSAEESFDLLGPFSSKLTGRTIQVTAVEGQGLDPSLDKAAFLKIEYGNYSRRTRAVTDANPVWQQRFEFPEVSGVSQLSLTTVYSSGIFKAEKNGGSGIVSFESIEEGTEHLLHVPLLKTLNGGKVLLKVKLFRSPGSTHPSPRNSTIPQSSTGHIPGSLIHLEIVEARDLKSVDKNQKLDPYVSVRHGSFKKRTKVLHRDPSPQWNESFELPYRPEPIVVHVKDHRSILANQSIGHSDIDVERLVPDQTVDRWLTLKELGCGEIRVRVTLRLPEKSDGQSSVNTGAGYEGATVEGLLKSSQKLRLLLQKTVAIAESSDESAEIGGLVDDAIRYEEEREAMIGQLRSDRQMLLDKVAELESVMGQRRR